MNKSKKTLGLFLILNALLFLFFFWGSLFRAVWNLLRVFFDDLLVGKTVSYFVHFLLVTEFVIFAMQLILQVVGYQKTKKLSRDNKSVVSQLIYPILGLLMVFGIWVFIKLISSFVY